MIRYSVLLLIIVFPSVLFATPQIDDRLLRLQKEYQLFGGQGAKKFLDNHHVLARVKPDGVYVPVIINRRNNLSSLQINQVHSLGGKIDAVSKNYARLLIPARNIHNLNKLSAFRSLRLPYPVTTVGGAGDVVSESVSLTGVDYLQNFGLDGSGVKVAVVDLGFSQLTQAISTGNIPANVITQDFTNTSLESTTQHGTGVAEHLIDMAPNVSLYCIKIGDIVGLEKASTYMRDNGIDIANLSLGWPIASYYDDTGPINKIINDSYDIDNVFWAVAVGNSAKEHWRGVWSDSDGDNILNFAIDDEHMQLFGTSSSIQVFLNWDQYNQPNRVNLNFYLLDNSFNTVMSSTSPTNPYEIISFDYNSSQAPYYLQVRRSKGDATSLDITIMSFNHNLEHAMAASSMLDPANAHGAFTVGAVGYNVWNNTIPSIRSYSSQGPSNDGRMKPDIVAPDGTASQTYGASYGTSFSSPTTAGAAAIFKQFNLLYSATDLANVIRDTGVDIGAAGHDTVFGAGKLSLATSDFDDDGLVNGDEELLTTNPINPDSDNDGLNDGDEVNIYGTIPIDPDTDSDGINDGDEVNTYGTSPTFSNKGDIAPRGAPNGIVDAGDYAVMMHFVLGEIIPTQLEESFADINNDGFVNMTDLILLRNIVLTTQ